MTKLAQPVREIVPAPLSRLEAVSDALTVLQVAFRHGDLIFTMPRPARRATALYDMARLFIGDDTLRIQPCDQGFLLSDGSFCARRRAYDVAFKAGQILPRKPGGYDGPELYSEDLW